MTRIAPVWDLHNISDLAFGCEPLGGVDWGSVDISEVGAAVAKAVEQGINLFDTAAVYGLGVSEERLATCLGCARHDVFISTKAGFSWPANSSRARVQTRINCSPETIVNNVHDSLRRLKIDVVPVLFVHYPDDSTALEDVVETLEKLRSDGKIANIGYSNFDVNTLTRLKELHNFQAVQFEYSLLHRECEKNLLKFCRHEGLVSMGYGALCRGLLAGKFTSQRKHFPDTDRRSRLRDFDGLNYQRNVELVSRLKPFADKYSTSISSIAIRWLLQFSGINSSIVGVKTLAQFDENLGSLKLHLSGADIAEIDRLFRASDEGINFATSI